MFRDTLDRIRNFAYYLIILIVSILATCFLPMISSEINVEYTPPQNTDEWMVFFSVRGIIGVLNVIIFYCFTKQAEVNIKDNENYKRANEILNRVKHKHTRKPKSPAMFKAIQWSTKATTLLISSVAATFTLAGILLRFELEQLLVYLFVIFLGVLFGYITMRNHEYYWTHEYYEYALLVEQQEKEKEKQEDVQGQQDIN